MHFNNITTAGAVDREFVYIFWAPGGLGGAAGQRGGPGATEAIARRLFDFLRHVPRGITGFEAISDQGEGRLGGVISWSGAGRVAAGRRPEHELPTISHDTCCNF